MSKLISALITLISALAISAVAAFVSVSGMMALFSATASVVCVMMIVLESSKLVAAGWLHANWKNPNVNFIHKTYLSLAVVALMIITSIGIYGFLSKGHLEQAAPMAGIELQINAKQQEIQMLQDGNNQLMQEQKQLDAGVNAFLQNGSLRGAQAGLKARNRQSTERANIQKQLDANNAKIQALNAEILPLKQQNVEVEAKLGPVKYVAQLFGWQDTDKAVRLVILTIMFAFDPLAVILLISATISFGEYLEEKRKKAEIIPSTITLMPTSNNTSVDMAYSTMNSSFAAEPTKHETKIEKQVATESTPEPVIQETVESQAEVQLDSASLVIPDQEDNSTIAALRSTDVMAPEVTANAVDAAQVAPEVPQAAGKLKSDPTTQPATNDKERLIEILESRPEFLQQLIDVIGDHIQQSRTVDTQSATQPVKPTEPPKPQPWLK